MGKKAVRINTYMCTQNGVIPELQDKESIV